MGLREKVALVFTTLAITQISTIQCVPSGSRTAALQRHLEARGIKSTQSLFDSVAKVTKTTPPQRSMYKAYNFPENEYPVDSSPRDPYYYGIDLIGLAEHEAPNQNFKAYNDMKKDMRMKRKLNTINENHQVPSDLEPIWLQDKDMFPEVQYPLKSMDTWVPYYPPSVLTQNEHRHKFSELLFEKNKKTSEKEDLKLKTKRLLDEINKIKEKIYSSKTHSKSTADSTGLYTTQDSSNTATLIKPDTNATQISFQITDVVNNERLANISTLKSSETEDISKQSDTTNITTISNELPMTLNTDFDNTSVMPMPIPYEACEWRHETGSGVSTFKEEPETSFILENKGNSSVQSKVSMQSIDNSTTIDNTGDNFQQVITNALVNLILTHISSKKNKNNQASVSNDTDTRTCGDSDAKLALVEDEQGENLLPNDAQKQQGTDSMPNDDPFNVKLLLPASSKDESIPTHVSIKNDTQLSDVNKASCSSIIVIPVSDSVNKIQLPIVETSTATPIIVFIPATQHSNISVSPSTNTPNALPFISEGETNVSLGDLSNISFIHESSKNVDDLSDLSNVQQIDATSVKTDFETHPNNSMCHDSTQDEVTNVTQQNNDTSSEKNVSMIDIVSTQDNLISVSSDLQSSTEPYPNTCVEEVSSDDKIIAIDKLATTEEVFAKPLLIDVNTSKDTKSVSTKDNSSTTLRDNIDSWKFSTFDSQKNDLFHVEHNVSSANAPADMNKETDVPSSKALASYSSVSNDHQLSNQTDIIHEISNDEKITDINDLPTTIDKVLVKPLGNTEKDTGKVFSYETVSTTEYEMGIRNISTSEPKKDIAKVEKNNGFIETNKEITPLNKPSEIQDADEVKNNPTILGKIGNEFNNEVLADTLEDKNIKGRSLSDSTNDSLLYNASQSNELKVLNVDTSIPMKDDLETLLLQDTLITEDKHLSSVQTDAKESPPSKNNTLLSNILTNTTRNDPQLVTNDPIPNDEFVEIITKDTQKALKVEERADATTNESEDSLTSRVNQWSEQNQIINTTDSLAFEHSTNFLVQDASTLDKNQDLPHLGNPSPDKNSISLPKGMLICSGISEVPRYVKNETLPNYGIASSPAIKQTDVTNDNIESGEAILPRNKILQETPVAEIANNDTITKVEVQQCNDKTILGTVSINKTKNSSRNITFNTDFEASVNNTLPDPPHSNIVDNNTLLSNNESKQLIDKINTPVTQYGIPLKDSKSQENLSEDSKVIQDAQAIKFEPPKSAENDLTSAELSGLIKYLYDAV